MCESGWKCVGVPERTCATADDAELWIIDGTVEVISEGHWKLISS
jgi:hypothetical protein